VKYKSKDLIYLCNEMHVVALFQAASTKTLHYFNFSLTFVACLQKPQSHVVGGASDTLLWASEH
jgi:hypothetical protein